jgi:nitrite reductase/ring-hydroxylating ferredoxin subunit
LSHWHPSFPALQREMAATVERRHLAVNVAGSLADGGAEELKAVSNDMLMAAGAGGSANIVIVIDQFEKLLTQTPPAPRAEFVAALRPALGGPVQVLATLRPEYFGQVASDTGDDGRAMQELLAANRLAPDIAADGLLDAVTKRVTTVKATGVGGYVSDVAVRRVDGRPEAVSGVCTHQRCRLWFDKPDDRLRCPCHSTSFSPIGQVLSHQLSISPGPLPKLQVRENDGAIEVLAPPEATEPS